MKCKGSDDPWIATRIAADIDELGYGGSSLVLKADQEVAIADVQRQKVAARSGETVPINSPVGESRNNGRAENAVQRTRSDQNGRCRTDHKTCERPNRQVRAQEGTQSRASNSRRVWRTDHVHDVTGKSGPREDAKILRRNIVGIESEG